MLICIIENGKKSFGIEIGKIEVSVRYIVINLIIICIVVLLMNNLYMFIIEIVYCMINVVLYCM